MLDPLDTLREERPASSGNEDIASREILPCAFDYVLLHKLSSPLKYFNPCFLNILSIDMVKTSHMLVS